MKEKYINLLHDWGFKYLFKREQHKDLLIKFLNGLLHDGSEDGEITDIRYLDTDIQSEEDEYGRNSSLDLLCTDQKGDRYMIEVQCAYQNYIRERSLFYVCQMYARSGKKGEWDYHVKGIISINILNFKLKDDIKFRSDYLMLDTEDNTSRLGGLRLIFLQVPRISDTFEECNSLAEKWMWGLKNISKMKNKPLRELKEEFQRISELADMASLSEKERRYYQCEEKRLRDYINSVESSVRERVEEGLRNGLKEWREAGLKEGKEAGLKEGREAGLKEGISKGREEGKKEGREEGKKSIAKSFKESGVSIDIISKSTGLTIEEINNL